jgi:hypothetical protein
VAGTEEGIRVEGKAAASAVGKLVVAAVVVAGFGMRQDRGVAVGGFGVSGWLGPVGFLFGGFCGYTPGASVRVSIERSC